jgi:hypothetical protein
MLKDVTDEAEKALVMEAVLRSQTQAYYGPRNAGHFGLSLGSYAHFTSPIRRYSDLLVHRALVDAYDLEQPRPQDHDLPPTSGLADRDRNDLARVSERSAPANGGRWKPSAKRSTAMWRHGWPAAWAKCSIRASPASRSSACSPRSSGWAATGWCRFRAGRRTLRL